MSSSRAPSKDVWHRAGALRRPLRFPPLRYEMLRDRYGVLRDAQRA